MAQQTHLVVAPHPDDELLGCGGTLLRARAEGHAVHWVIVTEMTETAGFTAEQMAQRQNEIERVAGQLGCESVRQLGFPAAGLTSADLPELIAALKDALGEVLPDVMYLPFYGDAHTDHRLVFDAGAACAKWFRAPSLRKILCYEVMSETEAALGPAAQAFQPTLFVDIEPLLEQKLAMLQIYASELGDFPFPRSVQAVRALAELRGASAGFGAAEAFMVLAERY